MGWNDENDWFVGPEFEDWQYDEMPHVLPKTEEIVSKVRGIFPNAIVFKDNHSYHNRAHVSKWYGVGECSVITVSEPIMITGDYQSSNRGFYLKGKWSESVDEAWETAWDRIQETMLKKFEQ